MHRRTTTLIKPRLQLALIGWFLCIACLALVLQVLLLWALLAELAASLPEQGAAVAAAADDLVLKALLVSLLFLIPVTLCVGTLVTFRIAGPIRRFEEHFERLAKGEAVPPCKIRRGDHLQDLCQRINAAVATLRSAQTPQTDTSASSRDAA